MKLRTFSKDCILCLIYLTSDSDSNDFISLGILDELLNLLNSNDEEIVVLSLWCISNIAGKSVECRDIVLGTGVFLNILNMTKSKAVAGNAAWCISNLCKGRPYPGESVISAVLKEIPMALLHDDKTVVFHACEAIYYATSNKFCSGDLESIWVSKLIELLNCGDSEIEFTSLKIMGNLVFNSDAIIKVLLDMDLLDNITHFLERGEVHVKKEALLLVSNLCAGPVDVSETIISHQSFRTALEFLKNENLALKCEAVWILKNINSSSPAWNLIVELGVVEELIKILDIMNPSLLKLVLGILNAMLDKSEIKYRFSEAGGIDTLEKLQKHPNTMIYFLVVKMMDTHFGIEEV